MEAASRTREVHKAGDAPGLMGEPGVSGVLSALASVTEAIAAADRGIAQLQAGRELLLVMAVELSHGLIDESPLHVNGPAGFEDARVVELAQRSVAAEIATATRASDRSIQHQMNHAMELVECFPATLDAFCQGRISASHVRVIRENGTGIEDPAARARYETAVLPVAEVQAPGRVKQIAARAAQKTHPEPLQTRHDRACEQRRVWLSPLPDGMAELGAVLPATLAHGVFTRLTTMATTIEDAASGADIATPQTREPRTRDQLRADLLTDLLLHGAPGPAEDPESLLAGVTARVEVTVPVLTLIGPDQADHADASREAGLGGAPVAAELHGRHPIDPHTARLLAGNETAWNRVLTDPITGAVLAVDRYRPGEDLKRLLHARDSRCRFPGCNLPAADLDLDHTQDAAHGGPTTLGNLAGLCRRHHMLKHHTHWTVKQTGPPGTTRGRDHATSGILEWTSPTGRTPRPPTHTRHDHHHNDHPTDHFSGRLAAPWTEEDRQGMPRRCGSATVLTCSDHFPAALPVAPRRSSLADRRTRAAPRRPPHARGAAPSGAAPLR